MVKGAAWGAALLVSALAILPFLPTLGGQFLNWDDGINFVTNPGFRGLGWAQLRWMATTTLLGHWVPLTWLSLGVNYALVGSIHGGTIWATSCSTPPTPRCFTSWRGACCPLPGARPHRSPRS